MELKKDVEIYRNVVIDSLFDVTSFPIKMLICKLVRMTCQETNFHQI